MDGPSAGEPARPGDPRAFRAAELRVVAAPEAEPQSAPVVFRWLPSGRLVARRLPRLSEPPAADPD